MNTSMSAEESFGLHSQSTIPSDAKERVTHVHTMLGDPKLHKVWLSKNDSICSTRVELILTRSRNSYQLCQSLPVPWMRSIALPNAPSVCARYPEPRRNSGVGQPGEQGLNFLCIDPTGKPFWLARCRQESCAIRCCLCVFLCRNRASGVCATCLPTRATSTKRSVASSMAHPAQWLRLGAMALPQLGHRV